MAIFYVKQKSVCNPVVLSLSLFQKGKQPFFLVRLNFDVADVVSVLLNGVFDDFNVYIILANDDRFPGSM